MKKLQTNGENNQFHLRKVFSAENIFLTWREIFKHSVTMYKYNNYYGKIPNYKVVSMCKNLMNLVASIFVKLKGQDIIVMANQEVNK